MAKPVTPLAACDIFVLNDQHQVLLIKRADNGFWALPGGCHDLGETPKQCAERECLEESGYIVEAVELLGVYSSNRYDYVNYPWKDNEFCHLLFRGKLKGGESKISSETTEVKWFSESEIPALSDGHQPRIEFGFKASKNPILKPHFE